jgi:branched-chain amino acid transport system permease protein
MQIVISGLALGCVYALIALGFMLIYKATETVNFAQGELMMVGAFIAYTLTQLWQWPFLLAVPAAVLATALVGAALQRTLLRPIEGESTVAVIMVTLAIAMIARGLASMVPPWGTATHQLKVPYHGQLVDILGVRLSMEHVVIIGATAAICLALHWFFRSARVGVAMRAISQNQLAAHYAGIPVSHVNALVWGLSGALAAVAGILLAPITFVHVNMGHIGILAFPAAVIGGLGSVPGAVAGGLILGLSEALAGFFLPEGAKDIAPYVLVLVVLLLRPAGLFGEPVQKKV